jgi:tetratricopeptide (TPR) repeat protein
VSDLAIGLLTALLTTNQPAALSNLVVQKTGVSIDLPAANDPVEREYQTLLAADDAAQAEVDEWIQTNNAAASNGESVTSKEALNKRIEERFGRVRKAYEDFLEKHPEHARARLAYGSFLLDIGDEERAVQQMERAREQDPKNPAAWNNLANIYGHSGSLDKAFEYYAKAIELNTNEPVYYQNLATTVYLFRPAAMEFYKINEQQIFDKALDLYKKAVALDPTNFPLYTDYAQSYYGIKPLRTNDALVAWTNALKIAHDDVEREGVYVHLARIKTMAGQFDEARKQLDALKHPMYAEMKKRLLKNVDTRQRESTNSPAAFDVGR